jgi:hypothetical protein
MLKASLKRQLVAWYIDFLFASFLAFLLAYFFQFQNWLQGYGSYLLSAVMFLLARIQNQFSLGYKFLSIDGEGFVDVETVNRESFWLMFLATILVLDGTKQLVRWADFSSWPMFGHQPEGAYAFISSVVLGLLSICAGYWIFKLDRRGYWMALVLIIFWIANAVISRPLMNGILQQRVTERRALQGLPIRPSEIEFMQLITTPALVVTGLLIIALLFWQRRRFR